MATSGPTNWTSIGSISALEAELAPTNLRIRRMAVSCPGSLRLALPVKTSASGEYRSSRFPGDLPDNIFQNLSTSARISWVEILAATTKQYHLACLLQYSHQRVVKKR